MTSEDDFAPIWEESILLAEHEAVQASVDVGGWLSAALDDPNVCEQMKADINRWFSSGFLYLDSVRQLMQADREAVRAEQAAELAKFKALAETLAGSLDSVAWSNYYGIKDDMMANGCEHGFKPASSCPNKNCDKGELERAIDEALRQWEEARNGF